MVLTNPSELKHRLAQEVATILEQGSQSAGREAQKEREVVVHTFEGYSGDRQSPSSAGISLQLQATHSSRSSQKHQTALGLKLRAYELNTSNRVGPESLVALKGDGALVHFFLMTDAVMSEITVDGQTYHIFNSKCLLSQKLMGKKPGDRVDLTENDWGTVKIVEIS